MDPIGLALENFDEVGRFRTTENGQPIDASGQLDGVVFTGPAELAAIVARHPQVPRCLATTLLRQAAGDLLAPEEETLAETLDRRFAQTNFNLRALLLELVTQPAFRHVRAKEGT
jgi:hypothetical protein